MSRQLSYAIIADGGTDRALVPILEWAIHDLDPEVDILEPDFCKRHGSVAEFLSVYETGAMLIFVHRDAEGEPLQNRLAEFKPVTRDRIVPVVPVRMTEAWLLTDPLAIALAADRPGATVEVPPIAQLESIADPKGELEHLLLGAANDLSGRRRRQFKASLVTRRVNVATLVSNFESLERLQSFQVFQEALRQQYPYRNVRDE